MMMEEQLFVCDFVSEKFFISIEIYLHCFAFFHDIESLFTLIAKTFRSPLVWALFKDEKLLQE